jgi:hypothetical protein
MIDDNLIQNMFYHSSCSSNLFLKDRFGAIQLVEWLNDAQGKISCFVSQNFELDITIPIDIEGGPATVTGLTVASNVEPYFFNLTDDVFGTVVPAGGTFQADIGVPIDLTQKKTYTLLITVDAVTTIGRLCRATELTSFTAGYPLPPIFPTLAPTLAPTGTDSPTPDPERTVCSIVADIECSTFSGKSCIGISLPTDTVCNSQSGSPDTVDFQYNGFGLTDPPDEIFVRAIGGKKGLLQVFNGVMKLGEAVRFSNGVVFDIEITFLTVDANGFSDTTLTSATFSPDCSGNGMALLDQVGPLKLIGFTSREQGSQNAIELVTLKFVVGNAGSLNLETTSAVKNSALTG